MARATSRDPDQRPADARRFLAEVVAARRAMSEGELDTLGPALAAMTSQPDQTLVVDLNSRTASGARRGDTGPLGASGGVHAVRARRSKGPLALLLVLVVAAVLSGGAWLVAAGPLSKTTTPSLVGLTRAEAAATAHKSGLSTHVQGYRFSEVAPVGEVVATDPSRGEQGRQERHRPAVPVQGPGALRRAQRRRPDRGLRPEHDRGQPSDRRHGGTALQQQGRRGLGHRDQAGTRHRAQARPGGRRW